MKKKTKNAADVRGLAATPTITIEEVKEGLKKIIKFEFENYQGDIQTYGGVFKDIDDFHGRAIQICISTMNELQSVYILIDVFRDEDADERISNIIKGAEYCYDALVKDDEEEFVKAYSELDIDESVLQRIAKIVQD